MSEFRRRHDRVQRARVFGRAEIGIGVLWILFTAFVWVAMPGFLEPMFGAGPSAGGLVASAFVIQLLALAVMIRIYRATPESGQRTWRFLDD
jgi:hypothetical protein